jgi:NAD(P)-dependent dehydrogenase (short-subunit alcohol dehydrogenase family)
MRDAGGGSIIIMSSVAGLRGSAGLAGYCATKGGVRLFAKAVVMECAASGGSRGCISFCCQTAYADRH